MKAKAKKVTKVKAKMATPKMNPFAAKMMAGKMKKMGGKKAY